MGARVQKMTDVLRHRGPDGGGVRVFGADRLSTLVGLGHRRLAIIDLSDAGLQPMSNEDGTVWVVFNGEIYNFAEIRAGLLSRGHRFHSTTDTEVLVHLYEELGADLVTRLNGMFAFAVLDLRERRLVLARDHIGVKPLYYSITADGLSFGSEIKAVLAASKRPPAVNWQAIYDYFTYLYVPGPSTAFEGIEQLPPAHVLVYDLARRTHTTNRYWNVRRLPEVERASKGDIQEALHQALMSAVQRELVSDVPLGIFLSGGIDSSALAGLAKKAGVTPRTYTVDFTNPDSRYYSESVVAEETSRFLGTDHQTLAVDRVDPFEMLRLIGHFDQPFGNPTFYLQWLIAQCSREHITVALSGAGGDELFAGYPRYRAAQLSRVFHRMPAHWLTVGRRSLDLLRDNHRTMRLRRMREFIDGLNADPILEMANWTYYMTSEDKAALMGSSGDATRWTSSEHYVRRLYTESPFDGGNRLLHVDVQSFLVENLLAYTDRMSMAVGMEVRVPMLEPQFVELALNVPFRWKLGYGRSKRIMRAAFDAYLTPTVRRGSKRGFNAPLGRWIREDLDEYFVASELPAHPLRATLGEDVGVTWSADGVLSKKTIDAMRHEHRAGLQDWSHELFAVIAFDVWSRQTLGQGQDVRHQLSSFRESRYDERVA